MGKKEEIQEAEVLSQEEVANMTNVIPANEETTALVNWEEKLAAYAEDSVSQETVVGTWVSTRAGRLSIDKVPVTGNKLRCIIIADAFENAYYVGKYDPNNPQPPVCYAINANQNDLVPHDNVVTPQHDMCDGCPNNEWGTGPEGKGKACKNIRRLALLAADVETDATKVRTSEVLFLKLPVLSVRVFSKYKRDVKAETRRPVFAVMTEITTEPDPKAQFKIVYKFLYPIQDQAVLQALMERHEREQKDIDFPYAKPSSSSPEEEEEETTGKKAKF